MVPLRCSVSSIPGTTLSNVCFTGWPGAHHSVDICEGLVEWSGGRDTFHPSDPEEEGSLQLVRPKGVEGVLTIDIGKSSKTIVEK